MFELNISTSFSAAHQLRGYEGECESIHGHNWKITVTILTDKLNNLGIGIDFKVIKRVTDHILEELDHKNLNDLSFFKDINPSSENIAMHIYKRIYATEEIGGKIKKVTVYETDHYYASYFEG